MVRALLVCLLWAAQPASRDSGVRLTYLGNMGVLLEAGGRRIVIDGLHRGGLSTYAAIPARLLTPLETAREPFVSLTAALTTHRHLDHFDPISVLSRLTADTLVVYAAPAEVIDTLRDAGPVPRRVRIRPITVGGKGRAPIAEGIVGLDLPHNRTPSRRAENAGYIVEIGGLRVLHVGDADPTVANYAAYGLAAEGIDVAIVPYWYLTSGAEDVRRTIGARVWVAAHIPLGDTAQVRREVGKTVPNAIILANPGDQVTLPQAHGDTGATEGTGAPRQR